MPIKEAAIEAAAVLEAVDAAVIAEEKRADTAEATGAEIVAMVVETVAMKAVIEDTAVANVATEAEGTVVGTAGMAVRTAATAEVTVALKAVGTEGTVATTREETVVTADSAAESVATAGEAGMAVTAAA